MPLVATHNQELPPDQWLVSYTHPDDHKGGSQLIHSWATHGLDVDWLPDMRKPVDFFRTAAASVKTKRASNGHGERIEIAADEVQNNGTCDYQITVKVWDIARKVIEHEKAMRVTFNKQTSVITVDQLGYKDVRLAEIEQRIRTHFDTNLAAHAVPGQKIRNAIREVLLMHGAQNLRRKAGGLYFVPANWNRTPMKPILDGLANVVADLYGERGDFYTIKLIMDGEAQEMVRKHFSINANERAQEIAEKAWQRVRGGKTQRGVRSDFVLNLWNERRALMSQISTFDQLVSVERKDIDAALKDLDDAIGKLEEMREEN